MKLITGFQLLALTTLLLFSCKTDPCVSKESFLETFKTFTTEFEEKKNDLTDSDKEAYEMKFKSMVNDCYKKFKPDMTLKEKQDFWRSALGYIVVRYDGNINLNIKDELDDPFNQYIKDEVVELVKASGSEFLVSIQETLQDELPKLMQIFSSEMERIGAELLEMFSN